MRLKKLIPRKVGADRAKHVLVRKPLNDPASPPGGAAPRYDNAITIRLTKKLGGKPAPMTEDTSLVDKHAKAYEITLPNGDRRNIKGFAITGLGNILDTTGVTCTRWVQAGLLPKPIFDAGRSAIFHVEEARSFYRHLTAHMKDHRQYRPEHAELRTKLFTENAHIRAGLFPK